MRFPVLWPRCGVAVLCVHAPPPNGSAARTFAGSLVMSGSCAVSSTQGERGGGGVGASPLPAPPPQAAVVTVTAASSYDPSIEVNEWSGLLTYEQEVAVTPTFQDKIAAVYSPLITGKGTAHHDPN